jgi:protein-L-isoaspartate(D-aspartate) O-methyltransferase
MRTGTKPTDPALPTLRRAYARQMLALAEIAEDPPLEDAFAVIPRERFLGPPPWLLVRQPRGYVTLPSADPVLAYQDVLFALAPERRVNNGSPSLHAAWLHAARPRPGERVAHIGAGTGYYSAILAHLVGPEGHVAAVEVDPALAARARDALAPWPNVTVIEGDGAAWPREEADLVYVNFGVERPAAPWLERLRPGGRAVLPLGVRRPAARHAAGAGLLVGRGRTRAHFAARTLGPAFFVFAEGEGFAAPEADHAALDAAFEGGGIERVRSLRWGLPPLEGGSWFVGQGWSLDDDEPA